MKRLITLMGVILGGAAPVCALDAYPRTTLAEEGTATWCQYCPYAYQGLEVVHSVYDFSEFVSVRYYSSNGGGLLATPETDAAIEYYGISGFPTVIFNGTTWQVGGDDTVAAGGPYLGVVEGTSYFSPSPLQVEIISLDLATGDIGVEVTVRSSTFALQDDHVRLLLVEDNVDGAHTHVTRAIISDTISLAGQGSTAGFNKTFTIDPSWNTDELHAVVFVQQAADKAVIQATSSYPQPDYSIRAMVPFSRMQIGSSAEYAGEDVTVHNVGLSDTFEITLVVDHMPPGWTVSFSDAGGGTHTSPYSFDLASDAQTTFHVNVAPGASGWMEYHFEITSPNLSKAHVIPFTFFTDDLDALVVDDDGGESFESYFTATLDAAGTCYGVWDLARSKLTPEAGTAFPMLIWNVGWSFPSLDETDRSFLRTYLDNGGRLFLSGQDIGWDLNESDDNQDRLFYTSYLHASYIRDDTNLLHLDGVADDPITDGLSLTIAGGDGASNQDYPSEIEPADADAVAILNYQGDGCGAIRAVNSSSGARIVYLAFGFEAIDNATDRNTLMRESIEWMEGWRMPPATDMQLVE
jgi:hypothetical protein